MRIETRTFARDRPEEVRHVLLFAENERESQILDWLVGSKVAHRDQGNTSTC